MSSCRYRLGKLRAVVWLLSRNKGLCRISLALGTRKGEQVNLCGLICCDFLRLTLASASFQAGRGFQFLMSLHLQLLGGKWVKALLLEAFASSCAILDFWPV